MTEQFANDAATTLSAGMGTSDASLTVSSATLFPAIGNFRILIDSEIMLVTSVSGSTFNILRAQESTSVATHSSGATVTQVLTAGALGQLKQDAAGNLSVCQWLFYK